MSRRRRTNLKSGYAARMTSLSYRDHRFPVAIIQYVIWLYFIRRRQRFILPQSASFTSGIVRR